MVLTEVKMAIDQVKVRAQALGDQVVKNERDMCRDRGGGVADTHFSTLQEIWAYVTIKL